MKTFLHYGLGTVLLAASALFSCQQDIQPRHDTAHASKENLQYVKLNPNDDKPSFGLGESAPIVLTGRSKQEAWEAAKKMGPVSVQLKKPTTPQQLAQLEKDYLANFEEGSSQALTAQLFFAVTVLDKYWLHQPESAEKAAKVNHYTQLLYNHQYGDPFLSVGLLAYLKNNMEAQQWHPMAKEFLERGKAITARMEASTLERQKNNPSGTPMGQALDGKQLEHIAIRKQRLAELENMLARSR